MRFQVLFLYLMDEPGQLGETLACEMSEPGGTS